MFMLKKTQIRFSLALLLLAASQLANAQESPGLGVPATEEQIAGWDISISPEGENLPAGSGSVEQGSSVYMTHCIACHGAEGEGTTNDRLVGGHDSLASGSAVKTVGSYWPYATTLFDYIRRAMPYQLPGSLNNDEVYALTAFLLYLNEIVDEDAVMNASSLPQVEMPNRDNFVWEWTE